MAIPASDLRAWAVRFILALALVFPAMALAGDQAQFNAIGYSEDGRHFAFEQFGIQDGSGFPYADIFIIDLETDTYVGGAPFRARIDLDMADLGDARQEAADMAAPALEEMGITRPALPIALRGDGELDDEGLTLSYGIPSYGLARTEGRHALSLELFKAPSSANCDLFEGDPIAYALLRESAGEITELHRDARVPASRGCVITYKIYGVMLPFNAYDNRSAVAVLSVWAHGFEGPDRRFIALPVGER